MDENANEGEKLKTSWTEVAGRAGYAARGLIYLSIGTLATLVPLNLSGGKITDTKGVIQYIQVQPFGYYILVLLLLGLIGYSTWRFIQAIFDADDHGEKLKGYALRAGLLISSLSHSLLAFYLAKILLTNIKASQGDGKAATVATIFQYPFGKYIVFIGGLIFFAFGIAQLVKSLKEKYCNRMNFKKFESFFHFICKFGLITRGMAFFIMGGFLLAAVFYVDPEEAGGTKKVLLFIQDQPWGGYLLVLFGAGLFSFGFYSSLQAIYRDINAN